MTQEILHTCKRYIEDNNICSLQLYVTELLETPLTYVPDWSHLFHKSYLHACVKGRPEIAEWLRAELYPKMDPIQQIALRQVFPYGRHLLVRAARIEQIKLAAIA